MRRVALVSGHFPPSNLTCVHRARLWAEHLPAFGWDPVVVTTHWKHYEEPLDWSLADMVPRGVRVLRTGALPVRPVRLVGDLGVRALPWQYRAVSRLARRREVEFVLVTIPDNVLAMVGPWIRARHGIPYGIDFQDPWVHDWPGSEKTLSKAWLARRLGDALEPRAVRDASLLTTVAEPYLDGVLARHPSLRQTAQIAAIPIGLDEADFDRARQKAGGAHLFDALEGAVNLVYAGALLPRAHGVVECLFEALRSLVDRRPDVRARLRVHFIGTGEAAALRLRALAARHHVNDIVREAPARQSYADVLVHLLQAHGSLVIGSTEPHYSPSKLLLAAGARRPVLALLHERSPALEIAQAAGNVEVQTLSEERLPDVAALATSLARIVDAPRRDTPLPDAFRKYSAREGARVLAAALDRAVARGRPAR